MKVVITGSTGLAKNIKAVIEATPYIGVSHTVDAVRVEDSIAVSYTHLTLPTTPYV